MGIDRELGPHGLPNMPHSEALQVPVGGPVFIQEYVGSIVNRGTQPNAQKLCEWIAQQSSTRHSPIEFATTILISLQEASTSRSQYAQAVVGLLTELVRRVYWKQLTGEFINPVDHIPVYLMYADEMQIYLVLNELINREQYIENYVRQVIRESKKADQLDLDSFAPIVAACLLIVSE